MGFGVKATALKADVGNYDEVDKLVKKIIEEYEKRVESTLIMGRAGEPEEIGAAVAFLASPAASYVKGLFCRQTEAFWLARVKSRGILL